jgi:magnesium transporter
MSRRKKHGLPSGSLIHMGDQKSHVISIDVMDFNADTWKEFAVHSIEDLAICKSSETVSWINIDGVHDASVIQSIGEHFRLHPLLLEDLMNPDHRPKIEDFDSYIHFTLRMLSFDRSTRTIKQEQVSFVLGEYWVLSFQESPGDVFDAIRDRIRNDKGRIRKSGADYLTYALADIIVDHYFLIIDEIDEEIDQLEEEVMRGRNEEILRSIQQLKKELMILRKSTLPVRDSVGNLMKGTSRLISPETTVFLKDVYDHTLHISDSIEIYRETLNSLMEVHLSSLSNRLNQVMKVLTIISTIFIPLTFIVGVYGMNFRFMPELEWKYGYAMVWGVMIVVTLFLVYILRRNKWM